MAVAVTETVAAAQPLRPSHCRSRVWLSPDFVAIWGRPASILSVAARGVADAKPKSALLLSY